jgi:hypothetical protein
VLEKNDVALPMEEGMAACLARYQSVRIERSSCMMARLYMLGIMSAIKEDGSVQASGPTEHSCEINRSGGKL